MPFMILTLILSTILVFLSIHLILLPLINKRPIFIKGLEGSLFIFITISIIAALINPILYIAAVGIALFVYFTKVWVIYGVSIDNINGALDRAILASRASSVKSASGCKIDDNLMVKINNIGMKMCYIRYRGNKHSNSKKSELTKEIFRKFVQNHFI